MKLVTLGQMTGYNHVDTVHYLRSSPVFQGNIEEEETMDLFTHRDASTRLEYIAQKSKSDVHIMLWKVSDFDYVVGEHLGPQQMLQAAVPVHQVRLML